MVESGRLSDLVSDPGERNHVVDGNEGAADPDARATRQRALDTLGRQISANIFLTCCLWIGQNGLALTVTPAGIVP